jgi:hypothetical protein
MKIHYEMLFDDDCNRHLGYGPPNRTLLVANKVDATFLRRASPVMAHSRELASSASACP